MTCHQFFFFVVNKICSYKFYCRNLIYFYDDRLNYLLCLEKIQLYLEKTHRLIAKKKKLT